MVGGFGFGIGLVFSTEINEMRRNSSSGSGNTTEQLLPEENLPPAAIARRMFYTGCACLPVFWIMATIQFRAILYASAEDAAKKVCELVSYSHPQQQDADLRHWVVRCAIGSVVSIVALFSWIVIFQLKWKDWHMEGLLMV